MFSNLCVSLRIFHAAPATVVSAETNISKLMPIQDYLRYTMGLDRSKNLARLSIESDIAKQIYFDNVILSFAKKKACNPVLVKLVSLLICLLFTYFLQTVEFMKQ